MHFLVIDHHTIDKPLSIIIELSCDGTIFNTHQNTFIGFCGCGIAQHRSIYDGNG